MDDDVIGDSGDYGDIVDDSGDYGYCDVTCDNDDYGYDDSSEKGQEEQARN